MEIITEAIPDNGFLKKNYVPQDSIFVDIETMDLTPDTMPVYLIGTAVFTGEGAESTLFFAENTDAEKDILTAFLDMLNGHSTIITFNGATFDLPYLSKRCKKHKLAFNPQDYEHIDLYRRVRPMKDLLGLSHCRQKDIELFLGISREDTMSGGDLIPVYKRYCKNPNETDHELLIRHNADDVAGMPLLLPILTYSGLSGAALSDISFAFDESAGRFLVHAAMDRMVPAPIRIRDHDVYLIIEETQLKCAIPLHDGKLRYYFDNPKDYVFLPGEGKVIPKKLADAIPKADKRPAAPEECFAEVTVAPGNVPRKLLTDILRHTLSAIVTSP